MMAVILATSATKAPEWQKLASEYTERSNSKKFKRFFGFDSSASSVKSIEAKAVQAYPNQTKAKALSDFINRRLKEKAELDDIGRALYQLDAQVVEELELYKYFEDKDVKELVKQALYYAQDKPTIAQSIYNNYCRFDLENTFKQLRSKDPEEIHFTNFIAWLDEQPAVEQKKALHRLNVHALLLLACQESKYEKLIFQGLVAKDFKFYYTCTALQNALRDFLGAVQIKNRAFYETFVTSLEEELEKAYEAAYAQVKAAGNLGVELHSFTEDDVLQKFGIGEPKEVRKQVKENEGQPVAVAPAVDQVQVQEKEPVVEASIQVQAPHANNNQPPSAVAAFDPNAEPIEDEWLTSLRDEDILVPTNDLPLVLTQERRDLAKLAADDPE
jgi:hypothetical protein